MGNFEKDRQKGRGQKRDIDSKKRELRSIKEGVQ